MSTEHDPTDAERTAATQHVWSIGSYVAIGDLFSPQATGLAADLDAHAGLSGASVLDVATGTGTAAIALADRGARVTAVDLTPALLDEARRRAADRGLAIDFDLADMLDLPHPDGRFELVTSAMGIMFAPDPRRGASELARVCAPAGTIATTAWTRDSIFAALTSTLAALHPELPGGPDTASWAEPDGLADHFSGTGATLEDLQIREIEGRFPDVESLWDFLEEHAGPLQMARRWVVDHDRDWSASRAAVLTAWQDHVRPQDGGIVFPMRYARALLRRE